MSGNAYIESRRLTSLDVIAVVVAAWIIQGLFWPVAPPVTMTPDQGSPTVTTSQPPEDTAPPPTAILRPLPPETPNIDSSVVERSQGYPAWLISMPEYKAWAAGAGHYAAFAVAETGEYGWVSEYNDPEIAVQTALAYCVRSANAPCRIVAQSRPLVPVAQGDVPMTDAAARSFAESKQRAGFRDFALAEDGTYGLSWGYPTHAEARQVALAQCRARLRDRAADLPPISCRLVEWRRRDIQRSQTD